MKNVEPKQSTATTEIRKQTSPNREQIKKFIDEYKDLCEKYQLQIIVTPAWRVSQDTGDWRLVLQTSVGKIPEK